MRGTACTGDDDFDAAFFSVGGVLEKQVGRAVGGDDARFMGNTEGLERFGDELHGIPVGAVGHDEADEGVSEHSLSITARAVPFCLHSICQSFQSVAALAGRSMLRPYKTEVSEQRMPCWGPALRMPDKTMRAI